jgi:hypothetical protein
MSNLVSILIIAATSIKGVAASIGEIHEVDAADANILIANAKAERFTPVVEASAGDVAAALEQAKAELLERIAAAADIVELDDLLSEDPDIIAAYEQRLAELEK